MERHEILDAMTELKLYGMRASFDEIAGKGLARRDEIYPLIASLIRAERTHRQARSISYRISGAKFPVLKDLDKFVFGDTMIDEGPGARTSATGAFLDAKRNAIFIGGIGHRPKRISALAWHPRSFAAVRAAGSSTWSIWSTSSSRRRRLVAAVGSPRRCCAMMSLSSTNLAICRSASPAANCCSI